MKVGLAQINPVVGDISGNVKKIKNWMARAKKAHVQLLTFPELCMTGYPPRDLVEQKAFIDKNVQALKELARHTGRVGIIVGFIERNTTAGQKHLFNSAALLAEGKIQAVRQKTLLPTYDVFDESRHF